MMPRNRNLVLLTIVLGVYFLFQILLIRNVTIAQYDESIYLDVARSIRNTGLPMRSVGQYGRFYFEHLPGYVYLIGGLTTLFGENITLLRLITMLFGAGAISLTAIIGWRAQDAAAGFVAALLLALNGFFATYAYFIREETFFVFFILLACYFLLRLEETANNRYLLATTLSIAVAMFLKEIALAFLLAAAIYQLFLYHTWRARLLAIFIIALPSLLVLIVWLLWANTLDPAQLQITLNRWLGAFNAEQQIVDPRIGLLPLAWMESIVNLLFGWELVLLFLFALIYTLFRRRRPPHIAYLLLLYTFIAFAASFIMSLKESRHLVAILPTLCLLTGLLLPWSTWWYGISADRRRLIIATPLILLFLLSASPLKLTTAYNPGSRWDTIYAGRLLHNDADLNLVKDAGDYLAANAPPGTLITVVRMGPVIGYYAKLPYIFLYTRPFAENMEILGESSYVIIDSSNFWQQTPEETETLMQYIVDNFTVDHLLQDQSRQITIYRRKNS
jgi:4-amino-4-deoxy-L-arabinose transferase-like glycosyltransferase